MQPLKIDPDMLDAVAYVVKDVAGSLDGVRLDLTGRTSTAALDDGVASIRPAIHDLIGAADRMLTGTRDELAAMSEFLNLSADAVRKADGSLRGPP